MKTMFGIKSMLGLTINKIKWKRLFPGSQTIPGNYFPISSLAVGKGTYGIINLVVNNSNSKLTIGNWCSIATEVNFIISSEHQTDSASTYPFMTKVLKTCRHEALTKGGIVIGDNVWICHRATILDGVNIGEGAIVGAGSIVTRSIPPYTIAVGNPARVIKKRFSDDIIDTLLSIKWDLLNERKIEQNLELLYRPIRSKEDALELRSVINE